MAVTGLAFSGGGIRSAAFCSGVLRRLLERGIEVDYLSCVSGGGYTGTAYLDWKYREEKKARIEDIEEGGKSGWHEEFFDNMTQRSGYVCNWKEPIKGILDTVVLSCLVALVTVIQPVIQWGSYACPVAYMIDLLFGKLMRDAADCDAALADETKETGSTAPHGIPEKIEQCLMGTGKNVYTTLLFAVLFFLFFTCYFLLRIKRLARLLVILLHLSHYLFGAFLMLTFIPFTIYDFVTKMPLWSHLLVMALGVMVWISLPLLRSKTSYVMIIYFYSYFIYWRVYHGKLFHIIVYSEKLFLRLLLASGFALWLVPLVTSLQERLLHVYNRWRLQKAFYHKEGLGRAGCSGIGLLDICPLWTCLSRNEDEPARKTGALTLADLKGIKPEYLSNMVVNRWKISHESQETYELLIVSPSGIERLDRDSDKMQFEGKLEPKDVMLSDAMATSAAAVSTRMGKYDHSIEGLARLHTILGLEMGASTISDAKSLKLESLALRMAAYLIHIVRGLPLIVVPTFYYYDDSEVTTIDSSVAPALISFFVIHLVLAFIALIDTGAEHPRWWEKLARWFIVHISYVNFVREIFSKNNIGPMPPPILLLSDGGHVENLAILPLLKRRLPKIIVVDGGYKEEEKFYGESILNAMTLARTKLNCSFVSEDGNDVISDLLERFVKPQAGEYPRYYNLFDGSVKYDVVAKKLTIAGISGYVFWCAINSVLQVLGTQENRFKVYYQRDKFGDGSEGEILLIAPREPQQGVSDKEDETAVIDLHDLDEHKGVQHWGKLKDDNVSELTLCCCECCHRKSCQWLSKILCNVFPQHITANQFFTPRMFSSYHREGYRACAEANADGFLKDVVVQRRQSIVTV